MFRLPKSPEFKSDGGVKPVIFSLAFAATFFSLAACASLSTESTYYPEDLPQLTSCATPLILRHKTKANITKLDKERRLRAVGLDLYDGSANGRDLSGMPIKFFDKIIKGAACPQKDITTHYVTSILDFESYVAAKRDVRPIYVRHLKSEDIERDKNIQCEGVFKNAELVEPRDNTLTSPVYNEEICWLILRDEHKK